MHYVGIDVSKATLDCCWLIAPSESTYKARRFKNTPVGHHALAEWINSQVNSDNDQIHLIMEATGVYHQPLAYALFDEGFRVSVVNPARPKKFAEGLGNTHKTDARDSLMLALFGYHMKPEPWQPELPEIRELKALLTRLEALETDLQRESNRLEKALFEKASERVMTSLRVMIEQIRTEKQRLEQDIDDHINRYPTLKKDRQLLHSVPGVGPVISRMMLAVLHGHHFKRASQVAAYLGLIPKIQESGLWKGRSKLSKTGPAKVRAKLYMAAVASLQANPDIQAQYKRLLKHGKTKMQALGAAMRKLVQICFGVVKHQCEYRPQVAN